MVTVQVSGTSSWAPALAGAVAAVTARSAEPIVIGVAVVLLPSLSSVTRSPTASVARIRWYAPPGTAGIAIVVLTV